MGWIKDAHGIKGDSYVQLYAKQADWFDQLDRLYLLKPQASKLSEHLVGYKRPHKEGLVVRFQESKDRNYAETLRKSGVYIPEEWLESHEDEDEFYLGEIEGFKLVDPQGVELGVISGFGTNGVQDLLKIERPGKPEALVPLVEAFLRMIDYDQETVTMELPEGLLDE